MDLRALPSPPPALGWPELSAHPPWVGSTCFVCYGVRIGIRADDAELLARVVDHLPPGYRRCPSPPVDRLYSITTCNWAPCRKSAGRLVVRQNRYQVYAGSKRLVRTADRERALEALESDIQLTVAEAAHDRLFVHAGVVGWRGRALVIPGRSFSGKTNLVAALIQAGATYYSDEYAVFDREGCVHPYPRPLSLRSETGERIRRPAEELGASTGTQPLPVGLVLVTRYRDGARWNPRPITQGQAVLALLANTVAARREPELALEVLHQAVAQALLLKGQRPEAEEVASALLG